MHFKTVRCPVVCEGCAGVEGHITTITPAQRTAKREYILNSLRGNRCDINIKMLYG
jgi:hypothetical protein